MFLYSKQALKVKFIYFITPDHVWFETELSKDIVVFFSKHLPSQQFIKLSCSVKSDFLSYFLTSIHSK